MKIIVMAGAGFTDQDGARHHWGAELEIPAGAELDELLASGTVREDDRGRHAPEQPPYSEEAPDGE